MIRFTLSLLLALGLTGAAYAGGNDDLDIDKVNGSIHVPDNATVGKLSTVNGSVHVGTNSHAKSGETVNGGIHSDFPVTLRGHLGYRTIHGTLGNGASGRELRMNTVNGSILLRQIGGPTI